MTININDINFVYSGGSNNLDPSKSIGGLPSINSINLASNNLFGIVKREQAQEGFTDYRCFYIFNDNESDSIYNANVYFKSQTQGSSYCQIGLAKATDVQVISLSSFPSSGFFKLSYDEYTTGNIDWDNNYLIFEKNIQNALNNLDVLSGVVVQRLSSLTYRISFSGDDDYRNHSLLQISINNLSPSITFQIAKTNEGQPINSIAPLLPTDSTPPFNVNFVDTNDTNDQNKIFIGDLRPKDGVPIWIKRVTKGTVANDETNTFQFRLSGNLVKNPSVQPFVSRPCFYYE